MKNINKLIIFATIILNAAFSMCGQTSLQSLNVLLSDMTKTSSFDTVQFSTIVSDLSEQQRFMIYAKLRSHYCENYLTHGQPIPAIEALLNDYFSFDNRLGYFIFCTERQLFNTYTDAEFDFFSKNVDKSEYNDQQYVLDLYNGLKLYKHNCAHNASSAEYALCADYLDTALTFRPNDTLYPVLTDCLSKSQRYERLFYLECYRQYDRNNGNLLKTAQLYLLYRKIKHPTQSFAQLCQTVKDDVLSDTVKRFAISQEMNNIPTAANLTALDRDGQPVTLIQNQNNTIVLFFSVTCHNCIDEMNTLSKMLNQLNQRHINVIGIYTMYSNTQTAQEELRAFQAKHNYPFITLIDPQRSNISSKYGITSVPSILLLRDDGTPIGIGSFSHYGHLTEKFSSILTSF